MGQAKRRRKSGEVDYWYHGTNQYFDVWGQPPVATKYKKELFPHTFISLSKDKVLTADAGSIANGLCRSLLSKEARVLDLRKMTPENEWHWRQVVSTKLGSSHGLIQTYLGWIEACINGDVMRMYTTDPEFGERMHQLSLTARNPHTPIREKAAAHLIGQNFTREWIETVISPAKLDGYDAIICSEIDSFRSSGAKSCTNLYVFNPLVLSSPEWVSIPNEDLMHAQNEILRELGIPDFS